MSALTQLRRYAVDIGAVVGLALVALIVALYVLDHQRLRWPWEERYTMRAAFASAQAVMPGQGQTVAVAGVEVGMITGVELRDGRAVVEMEIDPAELPAVHADAQAWLRPKTGLQDMMVQLDPGSRSAPRLDRGATIPIESTRSQVDLHEVLAMLDADTRHYVRVLVHDLADGTAGRGLDLRRVFKASAPTLARTRRVSAAVTDRRRLLARLVRNLRVLGDATARRDRDLADLVTAGEATLGAVAAEDRALRASLARLPGTLDAARAALASATPFAGALRPALAELTPAARALRPALDEVDPLLRDARPAVRELGSLSRTAVPVLGDLTPALRHLDAVTPDLVRAFDVLVYVVNELAFNPEGPEEGNLFWLAWFSHNAASILSIQDAHGVAWRGQALASCSSYAGLQAAAPLLAAAVATPACPEDATAR